MDDTEDTTLTCREAGRRGGLETVARKGSAGMAELGRRGGKATSERYGPEHYAAAGRKGGASTAAQYGPDHYRQIGEKGAARMRELLARGRAAEAAERESVE